MVGTADAVTVAEVLRHLDDAFPFAWAEPWDRVGLLAGDPSAEVSHVLVSLDVTSDTLSLAAAHGANVLVTHHPAYLEPPSALTPQRAGVAFQAVAMGIALVACHTNLDRAPEACDVLPRLLGLVPTAPLERGRQPVAMVTTFVPGDSAPAVGDAMAAAGAGRIGEYRGCAFSAEGVGSFVPGEGTKPSVGEVGVRSFSQEVMLEMVCPPSAVSAVVAAARAAHRYEEPLIVVTDAAIDRGAARLGRVCDLPEPLSLRALATRVADAFSIVPRVWGDPDATLDRVATVSGGGGSLLSDAVAAGAGVLVTGEVRYHTALEALEAGVAVIEAGHDVTEWPHVPVLAAVLRRHPSLAERVSADEPTQRWWTP